MNKNKNMHDSLDLFQNIHVNSGKQRSNKSFSKGRYKAKSISACRKKFECNNETLINLWGSKQYLFDQWPPLISSTEKASWRDWLFSALIMASVPNSSLRIQIPGSDDIILSRKHVTWTYKSTELPPEWDVWCRAVGIVLRDVTNPGKLEQYVNIHSDNTSRNGGGAYNLFNEAVNDALMEELARHHEVTYSSIRTFCDQFEDIVDDINDCAPRSYYKSQQRSLVSDFVSPTAEVQVVDNGGSALIGGIQHLDVKRSYGYDLEEHLTWSVANADGFVFGWRNHGNTCFMNASLQCLVFAPSFAQLFLHRKLNADGIQGPCSRQFEM
jgi:hypothetical protein